MKTLPARMLLALGLGLLILTARAGAQDVQGWSDIYYDPPTDTVYADAYTHLDSSLDPYDTIYEALVTLEVVAPNGSYYVEGESYGYDAQASIMLSPSESGYGDYSETATHGVYIDGRDWYSLSSVEYQEGYGFIGFTPFRCPDDAEPLPPIRHGDSYFGETHKTTAARRIDLLGTSCNASPIFSYIGNWGNLNNPAECGLADAIPVPDGGSCVAGGTTQKGTPKTCYQTVNNGCTTTWCAVDTRIVNADCTRFLDLNGATVTKIPAGCQ